jgi:hypothetical protein
MAIRAYISQPQSDRLAELNRQLSVVVSKGIYDDGGFFRNPGGLAVEISPFTAVSYDGMTVVSDAPIGLTLTAGTTNVVLVKAKYRDRQTPDISVTAMTTAAWGLLTIDRDYYIVVGEIIFAPGAEIWDIANISHATRDRLVRQSGRLILGTVSTDSLLPAEPVSGEAFEAVANCVGDTYFVSDVGTFYSWSGAAWVAEGDGIYVPKTGGTFTGGIVGTNFVGDVAAMGVVGATSYTQSPVFRYVSALSQKVTLMPHDFAVADVGEAGSFVHTFTGAGNIEYLTHTSADVVGYAYAPCRLPHAAVIVLITLAGASADGSLVLTLEEATSPVDFDLENVSWSSAATVTLDDSLDPLSSIPLTITIDKDAKVYRWKVTGNTGGSQSLFGVVVNIQQTYLAMVR